MSSLDFIWKIVFIKKWLNPILYIKFFHSGKHKPPRKPSDLWGKRLVTYNSFILALTYFEGQMLACNFLLARDSIYNAFMQKHDRKDSNYEIYRLQSWFMLMRTRIICQSYSSKI